MLCMVGRNCENVVAGDIVDFWLQLIEHLDHRIYVIKNRKRANWLYFSLLQVAARIISRRSSSVIYSSKNTVLSTRPSSQNTKYSLCSRFFPEPTQDFLCFNGHGRADHIRIVLLNEISINRLLEKVLSMFEHHRALRFVKTEIFDISDTLYEHDRLS